MKLTLGAAVLAAALAVPAHAATASGIRMTFTMSGTCSTTLHSCTATFTNTSCIEREGGPRCTVDPATATFGAGDCTVLFGSGLPFFVHTQAFGDVRVSLQVVTAKGVFVLVGIASGNSAIGALTVVGTSGLSQSSVCPASFTGGGNGALVIAGV